MTATQAWVGRRMPGRLRATARVTAATTTSADPSGPSAAALSAERTNFPAESPKFGHDTRISGRGPSAPSPARPAPQSRARPGGPKPAVEDPPDIRPRPDPGPLQSPPAGQLHASAEPGPPPRTEAETGWAEAVAA